MKIYSNKFGHMTMKVAMNIYGKNPSKFFFSETSGLIALKLRLWHLGLRPIMICSNDDPGLMVKFSHLCFCMGKSERVIHWAS